MREIEFRAKAKNKNMWIYGDLIHDENGYSILSKKEGCLKIKPNTIGQYTGLKDKNGKKIFEGDIFEIEENEAIGVVVFEKGAYRIEIYGYREVLYEYGYDTGSWDYLTTEDFDMYYIDQMEIIGNIYDNTELLKGE